TLRRWLEAHPFEPCPNWRRVDRAVRRLAGWAVEADLLENPPSPSRGAWPQNVLRHSHASYAIAGGAALAELLFSFGHSGSPAMLRQHYVGRASKRDAIGFFSIGPRGETITQVEVVA